MKDDKGAVARMFGKERVKGLGLRRAKPETSFGVSELTDVSSWFGDAGVPAPPEPVRATEAEVAATDGEGGALAAADDALAVWRDGLSAADRELADAIGQALGALDYAERELLFSGCEPDERRTLEACFSLAEAKP